MVVLCGPRAYGRRSTRVRTTVLIRIRRWPSTG